MQEVAKQSGRTPAEVALNWVAHQPGVTSAIIGATSLKQLESNLRAITFDLSDDVRAKLEEVSQLEETHPYMFFGEVLQDRVRGGTKIRKWN